MSAPARPPEGRAPLPRGDVRASRTEGSPVSATLVVDAIRVDHPIPGGWHTALDGFSMQVPAHGIVCLFGPSGCGKTTALRALAGFEPLQAGTIRLGDELLSSPQRLVPPERRRMGMMFQEYALFPHLTVAQNVAFGLRRQPTAVQRERTAALLALVGLQGLDDRHPHELSGGQQQRVALARALAPQPEVLLLDEPFSNLDAPTRTRLATEIRAILRSAGQAAVLVTHVLAEAQAMADAIGFMHGGRIERWEATARDD